MNAGAPLSRRQWRELRFTGHPNRAALMLLMDRQDHTLTTHVVGWPTKAEDDLAAAYKERLEVAAEVLLGLEPLGNLHLHQVPEIKRLITQAASPAQLARWHAAGETVEDLMDKYSEP